MKLYKVLSSSGESIHGGCYTWSLPKGKRPGAWTKPIKGELRTCVNGYHLCYLNSILKWLTGDVYEAEYKGEKIDSSDKIVVRQARLLRKIDNWNKRTALMFAVDCATRMLPLYEEKDKDLFFKDTSARRCLEIAHLYLEGRTSWEQLRLATQSILCNSSAASAIAHIGSSRILAYDALNVAYYACEAVSYHIYGIYNHSARLAEEKWQTRRLQLYFRYGERVKLLPIPPASKE